MKCIKMELVNDSEWLRLASYILDLIEVGLDPDLTTEEEEAATKYFHLCLNTLRSPDLTKEPQLAISVMTGFCSERMTSLDRRLLKQAHTRLLKKDPNNTAHLASEA